MQPPKVMDSIDLDVLKTAVDWHQAGHTVVIGTVVRTWGSAPRPVGAMMVMREDGLIKGSVSGGCIEDDLIDQMRQGALNFATPELVTYGVDGDQAHKFGLPCGGTLQVLLEPVCDASRLAELVTALARRELITRTVNIATGHATLTPSHTATGVVFDGTQLVTQHGPRYRLLIIGAAQVSRYLADIAKALDYQVIVCDPREEYLDTWDVSGVETSREMPDDLIVRLTPDSCTAIVTLTHDPKLDDMALLEALKSPAFYVGAIGSRLNNQKRRERLALFDLTDEQIARLHGPVGLHIGARTPPEIAVSIIAEMTALRNGVTITQKKSDDTAEGEVCPILTRPARVVSDLR